MKTLKSIFIILFLSLILVSMADAQAIVQKDQVYSLDFYGYYESFDSQQVVTPDGTINIRINFMLPLDHPYINMAILYGPISMYARVPTIYGTLVGILTFYPNGRVMFNAHTDWWE